MRIREVRARGNLDVWLRSDTPPILPASGDVPQRLFSPAHDEGRRGIALARSDRDIFMRAEAAE